MGELDLAYCAIGIEVHKGLGRKLSRKAFIEKEISRRVAELNQTKKKLDKVMTEDQTQVENLQEDISNTVKML